jgi:hypothetical protein
MKHSHSAHYYYWTGPRSVVEKAIFIGRTTLYIITFSKVINQTHSSCSEYTRRSYARRSYATLYIITFSKVINQTHSSCSEYTRLSVVLLQLGTSRSTTQAVFEV